MQVKLREFQDEDLEIFVQWIKAGHVWSWFTAEYWGREIMVRHEAGVRKPKGSSCSLIRKISCREKL